MITLKYHTTTEPDTSRFGFAVCGGVLDIDSYCAQQHINRADIDAESVAAVRAGINALQPGQWAQISHLVSWNGVVDVTERPAPPPEIMEMRLARENVRGRLNK